MPFLYMYMPKGCNDAAIEKSLKEITTVGADLLENTLPRMIRIGIYESDSEKVYQGGKTVEDISPTVIFRVGPGRSIEAKNEFMFRISQILSQNIGCPQENVRCHILDNEEGHHFVIGGKPKDFSKKVK